MRQFNEYEIATINSSTENFPINDHQDVPVFGIYDVPKYICDEIREEANLFLKTKDGLLTVQQIAD